MTLLDQSHAVVLENLTAYHRAERCIAEANNYLQDTARGIANDLSATFQGRLPRFDFHEDYLQTREFVDWRGSGKHLISVGIELFEATGLVQSGNGPATRAFVYSEFVFDRGASQPGDVQFLRRLRPPPGFFDAPPNMPGYLFVRNIGTMSAKEFLDPAALTTFLKSPLMDLGEWLISQSAAITAHLKSPKSSRP